MAVIGIPDPEYGQRVLAVIEPTDIEAADASLAQSIQAHCRETLSGVKTPRQVDFVETLPRTETGKVRKQALIDLYETRTP